LKQVQKHHGYYADGDGEDGDEKHQGNISLGVDPHVCALKIVSELEYVVQKLGG
jgi:hypothetical protein